LSAKIATILNSPKSRVGLPAFWGAVGFVIAAWSFDEKLSLSGDNAEFITLARSITQGEGLSYINDANPKAATKYPFGFPLMLAPLSWIYSSEQQKDNTIGGNPVRDFIAMKWLVVILFGVLSSAVFVLAREHLEDLSASVVALLCAIHPKLVEYGSQVMSEIPYTLFSIVALFLFERSARDQNRLTNKWLVSGFFFMMWSYYVRSVGIVLVAAVILFFAINRQYRRAILLTVLSFVFALPWALRNHFTGRGSVYATQFLQVNPYHPDRGYLDISGLFDRVLNNLNVYLVHIVPKTLWPSFTGAESALNIVTLVIVSVIIYAGYLCIRQRTHLLLWVYILLFLVLIFLWPWVGDRFLLPIIPLLLFFAVYAGQNFFGKLQVLAGRTVTVVLCFATISVLFLSQAEGLQEQVKYARGPYQPGWQQYYDAGMWIRNNLEEDTIISCRKGFWMHVVSGRRTVGYKFKEPEVLLADMKNKGVDYVVVDRLPFNSTTRYLIPAIKNNPNHFRIVFQRKNSQTYVLAFQNSP
tara:strand:- start:1596 stop:3173 length:1578 start_codon:yes stop_codon:yes gene_type:complete